MVREGAVIVVAAEGVNETLLRQLRGPMLLVNDVRFLVAVIVSLLLHSALLGFFAVKKLPPSQPLSIEKIPERFARLIVDKPLPKVKKNQPTDQIPQATELARPKTVEEKSADRGEAAPISAEARARAQKRVAQRVARIEQKIRTVGVLGMLTGVGATARGPAAIDVLGATKKERFQDLEQALQGMGGIVRAKDLETVNADLVRSKDIAVSKREEIEDLIAGIGTAKSVDLVKKGDFVIQRPESIEGAASLSSKRDSEAIKRVVGNNKMSIRISYEKFLKRDPSLAGKITIRFTISASGNVTKVEVVENTTGSIELAEEIVRKIRMWKFEPIPEDDGDATVTYPFVFAPA